MTKLKTLKDYEKDYTEIERYLNKQVIQLIVPDCEIKIKDNDDVSIPISVLRKEAINWIKNCYCRKKGNAPIILATGENVYCVGCHRFIGFFNLKEEDLK